MFAALRGLSALISIFFTVKKFALTSYDSSKSMARSARATYTLPVTVNLSLITSLTATLDPTDKVASTEVVPTPTLLVV